MACQHSGDVLRGGGVRPVVMSFGNRGAEKANWSIVNKSVISKRTPGTGKGDFH